MNIRSLNSKLSPMLSIVLSGKQFNSRSCQGLKAMSQLVGTTTVWVKSDFENLQTPK